jgi:hypothetical protein
VGIQCSLRWLAFADPVLVGHAKVGILLSSLLAGALGMLVLRMTTTPVPAGSDDVGPEADSRQRKDEHADVPRETPEPGRDHGTADVRGRRAGAGRSTEHEA